MTASPSPRPAALDDAIYEMIAAHQTAVADAILVEKDRKTALAIGLKAAIRAASAAGYVLIPRAELEEAAAFMDAEVLHRDHHSEYTRGQVDDAADLANRLRQRSRG